ncbi:MAG: hypothetical protein IPO12_10470 [Flavobacteriales bacterium]|nr:hypothetical protein [Flavobacteriales bacterium]
MVRRMAQRKLSHTTPQALDQQVLSAIRRAGQAGITSQQLSLQLGFKDKSQRYLIYDALEALMDGGRIESGKKGRYTVTGGSDTLEGTIDIIASGAGYVRLQDGVGKDPSDVFVQARHVGTALHGDTVRIRSEGGRGARPEGRVLEVVKRRRTEFVGTLHQHQGRLVLVAHDQRVQRPFMIPPHEAMNARRGTRRSSNSASGRIVVTCPGARWYGCLEGPESIRWRCTRSSLNSVCPSNSRRVWCGPRRRSRTAARRRRSRSAGTCGVSRPSPSTRTMRRTWTTR